MIRFSSTRVFVSPSGLLTLGALALACAQARADMGSVWVDSVTSSSVSVGWSEPVLGHRLASSTPIFTVRWKEVSSYPYTAPVAHPQMGFVRVSTRAFTISDLKADTRYEVTVEAYAEKRTLHGEWINAKDRHVGRVRQKTEALAPAPNLQVTATGVDWIRVEARSPRPERFAKVRVGFKMQGSDTSLNVVVAEAAGPRSAWGEPNAERGWKDVLSTSSRLSLELKGLSPATTYELVAYGFDIQSTTGEKLASAMGRTAGYTRTRSVAQCVAQDHAAILDEYDRQIGAQIGGVSVIDRASACDSDLYRVRSSIEADDGMRLDSNGEALRFLIWQKPDTFSCWQLAEEVEGRETLDQFLTHQSPQDLATILVPGELDPPAPRFQRGDADGSGALELADSIRTLAFLYAGGAAIHCHDAADSNDNGDIDMGDAVLTLGFLFSGLRPPLAPFGACGPDPTEDHLSCEEYNACPR